MALTEQHSKPGGPSQRTGREDGSPVGHPFRVLQSLSVQQRLAIGYAALSLAGLAILAVALLGFQRIANGLDEYHRKAGQIIEQATALHQYETLYLDHIRMYLATSDGQHLIEANAAESDARRALAELRTHFPWDNQPIIDDHQVILEDLFASGEAVVTIVRSGGSQEELREAEQQLASAGWQVETSWDSLRDGYLRYQLGTIDVLAVDVAESVRTMLIAAGLFVLISVGHALHVRQAQKRSSQLQRNALRRIATGDVETPLDPHLVRELGDIGQAIESMRSALEQSRRASMHQGFKQEALQRQLTLYARDLHDALQRERVMVAKLRELDQMKSEFVTMVSHELKNPIAAIHGYARIMLDLGDRLSDQQRIEFTKVIGEEAEQLYALVDDVLLTSRIESDALVYQFQPVDLNPILRSIVDELQVRSIKHELVLIATEGVQVIWADPTRIRQVFVNLVGNAVKYSPAGGRVEVRVERDREHRVTRTFVSDQGIGVAPEDFSKLFQKFSRIHSDATAEIPGTGLGLYIAKQIIEAHRGRISVDSTVGQGTTFVVELPIDSPSDGVRISDPETRRSQAANAEQSQHSEPAPSARGGERP